MLIRHRCPKRIKTDGGKLYMSSGIESIFANFKVVFKAAAPYNPESNGMAERLICLLKDRLHHINKDQDLILKSS